MAIRISSVYKARMTFFKALLLAFCIFALPELSAAEPLGYAKPWQLDFQPPATPVMEQLEDVHNFVLIIITVVTLFVMALLAYVCVRFSRKNNPVPSKTSHNTAIEIAWTVIPIFILIAIAIPSLRLFYFMEDNVKPDMTLKVTGYQWYWGYEYPDYEVSYLSNMKKDDELDASKGDIRLLSVDNPVVVPVGATVRVLVTGADVIHSFAMPSFGVKTDAVPGRINASWFKVEKAGTYYGQCSELCGVNHGFMPIEIRAVEPAAFEAWVERAKGGDYSVAGAATPATLDASASETKPAPTPAKTK